LVVVQVQAQDEVENLVGNGGFEDGILDPWRMVFKPDANGDAVMTIDKKESFTGKDSLRVEVKSAGNHERAVHIIQQPLLGTVKKGRKYTYSAWMKAESARPAVLNTMKSGGGEISSPNRKNVMLGQEWREYWFTLSATADGDIRTEFVLGLSDVTLWIDHVRFYEGDYVDEGLGKPEAIAKNDNMLVTCWSKLKGEK
jgi:hypothetical protein